MKNKILLLMMLTNLCGCKVNNVDNSFEKINKISYKEIKEIYAIYPFSSTMSEIDISEKNYKEFYDEINVEYKICEDESLLLKRHEKNSQTYVVVDKNENNIYLYYIDGYFVFSNYVSIEKIKINDKFLIGNLRNCF